jgi:hypothetical protein
VIEERDWDENEEKRERTKSNGRRKFGPKAMKKEKGKGDDSVKTFRHCEEHHIFLVIARKR